VLAQALAGHHGVTLLIRSAEKLGLNDKQKEQLEELGINIHEGK